ncbi:MAG: hypothetical protein IIZ93_08675 [Acidaminococcaceae bacterium]|nr:hypothetical protein [Acidaminococcaceae bacterium]
MSLRVNRNVSGKQEDLIADAKEANAKEKELAAKEARRQYQKTWRAKNPDKVKAAQLRYWVKKAEQMKAAGCAE